MFSFLLENIVFTIIISIIVVSSGHYLWDFLRFTYSEKKTKDLAKGQIEKYKTIIRELQQSKVTDFLNHDEKQELNDDLLNYAQTL